MSWRATLGAALVLTAWVIPRAALAQPTRPEVFGRVGFMKLGGDEGSLGSGAAYGGAVLVPITRKLAVDVGVLRAAAHRDHAGGEYRSRRILLNPVLVYRWGSERVYAFAGGGVGGEWTRSRSVESNFAPGYTPPGWSSVGPGVWQLDTRDAGRTIAGKAGLVINPASRFLIRADVYWSARYVLGNMGLTIGAGFRL